MAIRDSKREKNEYYNCHNNYLEPKLGLRMDEKGRMINFDFPQQGIIGTLIIFIRYPLVICIIQLNHMSFD